MFAVSQVVLWYGVRWVIAQMDPMRKKKEESQLQAREIFEKLGVLNDVVESLKNACVLDI